MLGAAGFPYLEATVAFTGLVYVLHTWLDLRQKKVLAVATPRDAVASIYTPAEFEKKRRYNLAKLNLSMARNAADSALQAAFLLCGFLPATWRLSGALLQRWGAGGGALGGELAQSAVWVLIQAGISMVLGLPWSAYSTFVLEARHGFNRTTVGTFVLDTVKTVLLGLLFVPPLVAGFTLLLQRASPWAALHLWAFLLAVSLLVLSLYPAVAALFNKFEPLQEGSLRASIEALAASLSFPLKKLFVVDGSLRSAHSNAYMYGFGRNKRIVLYDTLIEQCSEAEVVAVLAHELGHWKLKHTIKLLVSHQLVSLAQLALFTLVRTTPGVFESFGFQPGERPALGAFLLFQALIGPVDEVLGLLSNVVSRRFEFQADAFAVGLGKAAELKSALLVLDKENKGAVSVDPLYSACHYSHPPLPERLAAIDAAAKKAA